MSQVFFAELEIPEPHRNLGVGSASGLADGSDAGRDREPTPGASAGWRTHYGDTNFDPGGGAGCDKARYSDSARRGRTALIQARHARGDQPGGRGSSVRCAFRPYRHGRAKLRAAKASPRREFRLSVMSCTTRQFTSAQKRTARAIILKRHGLQQGGYVLATTHRAENVDDPSRLRSIFEGLAETARKIPVVCPLHPRARKALQREGLLNGLSGRMLMIEPVSYLEMLRSGEGRPLNRDRLRRCAEGGLFLRRALCHVARRDRMDRAR